MRYPEMVKTNSRYRGPMESRKQTNSMKDIQRSLALAREELEKRRQESKKLMGELLLQNNYTVLEQHRYITNGVKAVRGGEL